MRKSRLVTFLSFALVLATLLGACAVPPPPATTGDTGAAPAAQPAEGEPVTLTWAMWGSPEEIATHQSVADAFMELHPEIRIEIDSAPWTDYFTKIQALWASGDVSAIPDVAFLINIQSYATSGVLENLDPYIEAEGYDLEDYWPTLLESAILDGSVYGLPRDIGLEVLYYNKDIFDEAGVAYPDDTWTWDDLLAAAEKLTVVEASGRVARHALGMEGGKYQLWVGQNHGSILDDMINPSTCTLAAPEGVEAVKFFADMMSNNYAIRDADLSQAGGDASVFASGQAAMIIQNASRVTTFNEAGLNYDVSTVPIPADGQRSAGGGGASWVMSSASDNKDEAWTFLSWLQSTDGGQALYTESGEILPALQSTAPSDAFLGQTTPPANRQAFVTEGENAQYGRAGYFAEWNELSGSIIDPIMAEIWAGDKTPEEALPALCEQVNAYLAEHGLPK